MSKPCMICGKEIADLDSDSNVRCTACREQSGIKIAIVDTVSPCSKTLNEQVKSLRAKIAELELKLKRYDQAPRTPFIKGGKCGGTTHSACDCVIKRTGELETDIKTLSLTVLAQKERWQIHAGDVCSLNGEIEQLREELKQQDRPTPEDCEDCDRALVFGGCNGCKHSEIEKLKAENGILKTNIQHLGVEIKAERKLWLAKIAEIKKEKLN